MKKKNQLVKLAGIIMILLTTAFMLYSCSSKTQSDNTTETNNKVGASNKGEKLNIIIPESKLEWTGKKITGQHTGTVDIAKGDAYIDNGKLTGGSFEIDFRTIKDLDITDPESNAKLTNHLKSDDFFGAGSFPIGKFEITSAAQSNDDKGNNYKITGNLTIKGITKQISFPAKVNVEGETLRASGDFAIDRTLFDIKFRSGKFFENLGDNLIHDDFNIKFNIVAK